MAAPESSISKVIKTYTLTSKSFKQKPILWVPFAVYFAIELITLAILYLAPRMPLKIIFAPPIRTFWGERFLHYPYNFLLLPKLFSLSRMFSSVVLGSLLTGMAVVIISHIYQKKHIKLGLSFKAAFKKYISLFTIVLIVTMLFFYLTKVMPWLLIKYFSAGHAKLLFLKAQIWMGPILLCLNYILILLLQAFFIYAIPVLLIGQEKLLKSIMKSFVLCKRMFIPTIILVGIPMLIYIPFTIVNQNIFFLINNVFPEFVLIVLIFSSFMSSLVVDALVTTSTTLLYLANKDKINSAVGK